MKHSSRLKILFVCTGNICRSPLAAQLLVAGLSTSGLPVGAVAATSRGTHAREGLPMEPRTAGQSESRGADPSGHLSQRLVPADLRAADLVVTMTLDQRAAAARMLPAASRKSVTLLELARLIEHHPTVASAPTSDAAAPSPRHRLEVLLSMRSAMPQPKRGSDIDIADPFGRSAGTHARVARQIDEAVSALVGWLTAAVTQSPAAEEPVAVSFTVPAVPPPAPEVAQPAAAPLTRREARALREIDAALSGGRSLSAAAAPRPRRR